MRGAAGERPPDPVEEQAPPGEPCQRVVEHVVEQVLADEVFGERRRGRRPRPHGSHEAVGFEQLQVPLEFLRGEQLGTHDVP